VSPQLRLLDRITGRVTAVGRRVLIGRFAVSDDASRFRLGDHAAAAGDYLVGSERSWLLRRDRDRQWWSGDFGHSPLPAVLVIDNVIRTAAQLAGLCDKDATLAAWTSVSPLVTDVDDRLRPHPLEDRIRTELGYLQAVCRDPHARLRTEHVLVPVSRARRITWRTVVHLSAHSETWAARRLHGVEPAQLLTPIQLPDYDVYENRVVAALVDRLWRHVLGRIAQLDDIDRLFDRIQQLLDEAASRPDWRNRERLFEAINQLLSGDDFDQRIEDLRRQLNALRTALAPLLNSKLRRCVRKPYTGQLQLRSTNLLVNDANYRHCRQLWDAWGRLSGASDPDSERAHRMADWCRAFARYTVLLVLRALDQLGLSFDGEAAGPHQGGPALTYRHTVGAVTVSWQADDTIVLRVDGRSALRVVPLPHALTASGDVESIAGWLADLAASATDGVAVIYPGESGERARLPLPVRLAVYDCHGGQYLGRALPPLVPVSPTDIDSVSRVARMLRAALSGPALCDYPVPVLEPCADSIAQVLAGRFNWLAAGANQVLVVRPPWPRELTAARSAINELRTTTERSRQRGDNREHLERLWNELRIAAERIRRLTTCPVCGQPAARPEHALQQRNANTYHCECECGTAWETRRCTGCKEFYLVLLAAGRSEETGGDGDRLDRVFAQDLMAVPCWVRARSYLCPQCGHCSEADNVTNDQSCVRCVARAACE
jgi:hypothetical protein